MAPAAVDDSADRLVAALLLRDAKARNERAEEEGLSAYLENRSAPRIDARLLKGEVNQLRSHNRLVHGIQPLPSVASTSRQAADAVALEVEFVRHAHELRNGPGPPEAKNNARGQRPRTAPSGAPGAPGTPDRSVKRPRTTGAPVAGGAGSRSSIAAEAAEASGPSRPRRDEPAETAAAPVAPAPWLSKGLRVRVVDEDGEFKASHLQKSVVRRVKDDGRCADVEVAGADELRAVPEEKLETIVSKTCKQVEIVRGEHRGMLASLLSRDPKQNKAVVRLGRIYDEAELCVRMDDICEFA